MSQQKHPITNWLDSNSRKEPPTYQLRHRSFETYYYENDKNLHTNNDYKVEELLELNKEINRCNNYNELIITSNTINYYMFLTLFYITFLFIILPKFI